MTTAAPIPVRHVYASSVPNGERTKSVDSLGYWDLVGATNPMLAPLYWGPRLTNGTEINAATGAVPTNNAPGFLSGIQRDIGDAFEYGVERGSSIGKKITSGIGSMVGSILPWWLWVLAALALVAFILFQIAPFLRRAP